MDTHEYICPACGDVTITTLIQTHCDACGSLVYERETDGERLSERERGEGDSEEDGGKQEGGDHRDN